MQSEPSQSSGVCSDTFGPAVSSRDIASQAANLTVLDSSFKNTMLREHECGISSNSLEQTAIYQKNSCHQAASATSAYYMQVLLEEAAQGQEGQWSDLVSERGRREQGQISSIALFVQSPASAAADLYPPAKMLFLLIHHSALAAA